LNLDGLRPWAGLAGDAQEPADVVVAGIPYDGSAVYRKGASIAPRMIREFSAVMPPVTEDGRLLKGLRVKDIGDLDAGREIETGWLTVAEKLADVPPETFLTVLGGDHCTAISASTSCGSTRIPTCATSRAAAIGPAAAPCAGPSKLRASSRPASS
jgi:arginase family enzyme